GDGAAGDRGLVGDCGQRDRVRDPRDARVRRGWSRMSAVPVTISHTVELEIDGEPVRVREGTTLLEACRARGTEIPTLCYGETLTPVNACRVCMVEVEGARVLVPSCACKAEDGMVVRTRSAR